MILWLCGFGVLALLGLGVWYLSRTQVAIDPAKARTDAIREYLIGQDCNWPQGWKLYQLIMKQPEATRLDEAELLRLTMGSMNQSPNSSKESLRRLRETLKKKLKIEPGF